MKSLGETLETARNPGGLLSVKLREMEDGSFEPKGKGKGKEKGGKGKDSASELTCPSGNCRTYFWKGTCPKFASGTCEFKHDVTKFPSGKGGKK